MKKLLVLLLVLFCGVCEAGDINLKWDSALGATGYKIYMSTDLGVTWVAPKDVGLVTTYTYLAVPDNTLVLFKVASYNAVGEQVTHWSGAWYDGRKRTPIFPSALSIP